MPENPEAGKLPPEDGRQPPEKGQEDSHAKKQTEEEKEATRPLSQKTPEEVAHYMYILSQQDPEYMKRYLDAAGFKKSFLTQVWEAYAKILNKVNHQELEYPHNPQVKRESEKNQQEVLENQSALEKVLQKLGNKSDKLAFLSNLRSLPGYENLSEWIKRKIEEVERGTDHPAPDNSSGDGGLGGESPEKSIDDEGNEEEKPEPKKPRSEMTLGELERELKNAVFDLTEFNRINVGYRRSLEGEIQLGNLQKEIEEILEYKKRRAYFIEAYKLKIKEADQEISELPEDQRKDLELILRDLRRPKEERESKIEIEVKDYSKESLLQKREEIKRDAGGDVEVLNALKEAINLQIRKLSSERVKNRQDEYKQRELDVLNGRLRQLEDNIRRLNSLSYRVAELTLDKPKFKKFKNYRDNEKMYRELVEEKEGAEGGEKVRDFRSEKSFETVLAEYRESKGIGIEGQKSKELIESYMAEANRRGYLSPFWQEINKVMDHVRARMRNNQSYELNFTDEEYNPLVNTLDQLLNDEGILKGYLNDQVNKGNRSYDLDVNGVRVSDDDKDLPQFEGFTRFWLEKIKQQVEDVRAGRMIEREFENEDSLVGRKGRYWGIGYAGYYEIYATTQKEFQEMVDDFGKYLISGAIELTPQRLMGEFTQFERTFSPQVERYLGKEDTFKRSLRIQLKSRLGLWSADYFAALANTQNYEQIMKWTFEGIEGMYIIPELQKAMGGLVGLATRFIDRDERFSLLFRYYCENGKFGLEENKSGDYEYVIRERTEELLAEEIMVYKLKSNVPGTKNPYASSSEKLRRDNLEQLTHFQTTEKFISNFEIDTNLKKLRDKVRRGLGLRKDEQEYYNKKLSEAREAVRFARTLNSALGERTLRAAPSYIVERYKTNESGWYIDGDGNEVTRYGQLVINNKKITVDDFVKNKDKIKNAHPNPQNIQYIYNRIIGERKFVEKCQEKLKEGGELTPEEGSKYSVLLNLVGDKSFVLGGELQIEQVDYVSKELGTKFMQFADNVARIIAAKENEERVRLGLKPLTQAQILAKATEYRRQARKEIYLNGLSAVIRDEEGNVVLFEEGKASVQRKKITLRDGNEVLEAANQKEGRGLVNIDSGRSYVTFLSLEIAKLKKANPKLSDKEARNQAEPIAKKEYKKSLEGKKLVSVDFDGGSSHVLSHWNNQTYIPLQQEIRSQILRPEIREAALAIRRGEVLPEGSLSIEEELSDGTKITRQIPMDVLASWRLQIDPTLTRLADPKSNKVSIDDPTKIILLQNAISESFQTHWKITRELDRQFFDYTGLDKQRVYYGIPNERFALKELIYNANKVDREASRFGRRGWPLIPESPVHWSSLGDSMGLDISGIAGVFNRSVKYDQELLKEGTDSNVLSGWIEDILKAYDVYVRFARGGNEKNGEPITSLMMKPFNDLDSAERIKEFIRVGVDPSDEITMYQAMRPLFGRLEALLKAIELQDNSGGRKGALWLGNAEIQFSEDGKVKILYYNDDGSPKLVDKKDVLKGHEWFDIKDKRLRETATGAHSALVFYHYFIGYANSQGILDYEAQAWAIWMMNKANYLSRQKGFKNFWDFFASKAVRTYPE